MRWELGTPDQAPPFMWVGNGVWPDAQLLAGGAWDARLCLLLLGGLFWLTD